MMEDLPNLNERDFILTWNLLPGSYDEAISLIPSLKQLPQESVVKMINFLNEKRGRSHLA
jgi:hypothetical protein